MVTRCVATPPAVARWTPRGTARSCRNGATPVSTSRLRRQQWVPSRRSTCDAMAPCPAGGGPGGVSSRAGGRFVRVLVHRRLPVDAVEFVPELLDWADEEGL